MKFTHILTSLILVLLMTSCSTNIDDYEESKTKFDIKKYFDGRLIAWGVVQDYTNKVTRRFCVEIDASWRHNNGTLKEKFYFNDGEISYRTWQLTRLANGHYIGTAEDVIGVAEGKHSGFAFQWQYQLLVPIEDDIYEFNMDDWMFQLDEHRVVNKTSMSKFGVNVAEITLFFDKFDQKSTCA